MHHRKDSRIATTHRSSIPQRAVVESLEQRQLLTNATFAHPGILNTQADFTRMATEVAANAQPWLADWQLLQSQGYAQLGASPRPLATVIRGGTGENFAQMYIDIQRAYDTALEWEVTGNTAYANQTVTFLNAWSYTMTSLTGDSDRFLASGLYGFQWANIAEIMRTYSGWAAADQTQFQNYLLNIYIPMNQDFLANHNTAYITNYWANWDLCNIASEMAIGIFTDRHDLYSAALNYVYTGAGNGAFDKAIYYIHAGNLGQGQEEGRDQGHSNLDFALMGEICQMAWNQGDDLFSYHDNEFLAGVEYLAKYNLGYNVPYEPYEWGTGQSGTWQQQASVSNGSFGQLRPIFDLVYNHYVNLEGLAAPYTTKALAITRPEGDYGNGDEPGWYTLTFSLNPITTPQPPQSLVAYEKGTGNIQLNWWGGANDTSYNIYRGSSASSPFTKIASGITDPLTYTDTNVPTGTWYYQVTGVSGATETAASNVAMATSTNLLVAELKFDETSGITASDSTGNGVTGTLNGGATFAPGESGNAVSLDGSTGYVSLPAGLNTNLSDFTIATWVYLNSSQTWARIFDFGDSRGDWMYLTPRDSGGQIEFGVSTVYGYNAQFVTGSSALPTNQWVHVALTLSNRLATLYVNGVAVGSNANIDFPPYELASLPNEWIGRSQFSADPYLNGKVDDFRIYRGAVPAGQIYTLATGNAAPAVPAAPSTLTATAVPGNTINLSWSSVSRATSYSVYRATTSGGPYFPIATLVTGTTYADSGLNAGTAYYYVVDGYDNGGDGALSPQSQATALPPLPSVPAALVTDALTVSTVSLAWTAGANDYTYTIRRSTTSGGPYTLVTSGVSATSYIDSDLTDGTTYYYVIAGDNPAGESANSNESSATPTDLFVHLKFDETSGSTAYDSSGNSWNGTLVNSPTWTTGEINNALNLNSASSQYVSLPIGVVANQTAFTAAAWVYLTTSTTWMRVFDFGTGTTNYMFLSVKNGSGVPRFAILFNGSSSGEQGINGTSAIPLGVWTHIAVTWSNNVGTMYVNGAQVGQNTSMTWNPSLLGTTTQNYIGHSEWSADPYFNGTVDDFRLYSRALSATEVNALAHTLAPAIPANLSAMASDGQVSLSWSAASGAATYNVKRSLTSGGPYTTIASGVTTASYIDTGLTDGTTYYYVVSAVNVASEGNNSTQASATPQPPPTVAVAASAISNPVTNGTSALSVLGADVTGESGLTYTWSVVGTPPLPVTFSPNGSNTAKNSVATFNAIGTYTLQVVIKDSLGQSATSTVNVTVNTILGTTGNDTIRLLRSGANLAVFINSPVTPTYTVLFATLGAIAVNTSTGADSVNVDFSGGASPVPAAGLTIVGNAAVADTLTITGTTGADNATIDGSTVTFNSSVITYSQVGSIIVNGNGGTDVLTQSAQPGGGATLAFNGGTSGGPSSSDSLIVNGGTFTFPLPSGIAPLPLASLSVAAGAKVVLPTAPAHTNRYVMVLSTLSIAGSFNNWTGTVDLGGNVLIVHGGNLTNLTNQLRMGFNAAGGYWNGTGIMSSAAQSMGNYLTTLGAIQNLNTAGTGVAYATFDGVTGLTTNDILVKYTYYGGADLSGSVTANDYTIIDAHNGMTAGATWGQGDFNYDGKVDGSDYSLIDNAFNMQGSNGLANPMTLIAAVPASVVVPPSLADKGASVAADHMGFFGSFSSVIDSDFPPDGSRVWYELHPSSPGRFLSASPDLPHRHRPGSARS
jgi:fibronectin type 3 domain-containing protein